jgi:DNA ligase (NAD+)
MADDDLNLETLEKLSFEELLKLKEKYDDIYYNTGENGISDAKYDFIVELLQKNPLFKPGIGAKLREGENRVELPFWLGSADKITPAEEKRLSSWITDNMAQSYVISEKLDGVSCLYINNGKKISLYTRGDGYIGADISYLTKFLKLPKQKTSIAIRGELIMKKQTFFDKYREKTVNGRQYKNPRNMVSGIIGGKTVREGLEDIDFVTYEIVSDYAEKIEEQYNTLEKLGFQTAKHEVTNMLTMEMLEEKLLEYRQKSEYYLDGLVVHANTAYDRNTTGNPDYMFAFKMLLEEEVFETEVIDVEWNISKWGQLKPVVLVKPVEAGGVTISRATGHNAKYIVDSGLGKGSIVTVTRSKDVIPYIVDVIVKKEPQLPKTPFTWDKNHVNIVTMQDDDNKICVRLLSSMFAKLGIKHVSEATVEKMMENGLDNLVKIVSADKERLLQVPEFKEKSAERIYTNIRQGFSDISLSTLLGASCVFGYGVGEKRVENLLIGIPNILDIYKTTPRQKLLSMIMQIEGFSTIIAEKIVDNLKYADALVKNLSPYITLQKRENVSNKLRGGKFVFSGFRDKNLEEEIKKRQGNVVTSVSKNTTALIVKNKNVVQGKMKKAMELGVDVYSVDEFIAKFL